MNEPLENSQTETEKREKKRLWLILLLLFLAVATTTLIIGIRLGLFLPDDSDAIVITPDDDDDNTDDKPEPNPSFAIADDKGTWETETTVALFRVSYENGERVVTVKSDNGEKVIAPGTQNSYTFKLKNTGNVAMTYAVSVESGMTPAGVTIPLTARLNRFDGTWIAGDADSYVDIPAFNKAVDTYTVGAGRFTYYTLDWCWPFEGGQDDLDTLLGTMAVEEDVVFSLTIKTYATESDDPDATGGMVPQTGDDGRATVWAAATGLSFTLLVLLLLPVKRKRRKHTEAEPKDA